MRPRNGRGPLGTVSREPWLRARQGRDARLLKQGVIGCGLLEQTVIGRPQEHDRSAAMEAMDGCGTGRAPGSASARRQTPPGSALVSCTPPRRTRRGKSQPRLWGDPRHHTAGADRSLGRFPRRVPARARSHPVGWGFGSPYMPGGPAYPDACGSPPAGRSKPLQGACSGVGSWEDPVGTADGGPRKAQGQAEPRLRQARCVPVGQTSRGSAGASARPGRMSALEGAAAPEDEVVQPVKRRGMPLVARPSTGGGHAGKQ